jgi:VWFA-related protein
VWIEVKQWSNPLAFGHIIICEGWAKMCGSKRHLGEIKWRLITGPMVFLMSAAVALAQGSAGQKTPGSPSSDAPHSTGDLSDMPAPSSIRIQSNLVTAPVTVVNKATGEFVYDLKQSDFQILDNGKPQHITNFAWEPHKVAAVILIQDNDAVAPLLNEIKQLAPVFTQLMLGPKGEAAVITFDSAIHVQQGFSSDEPTLDKTLQAITSQGNKARLNDSLMQAMNLLEHRPIGERKIIIVFSNGYDSGSQTLKEEVIRRATGSEVEIYGLGLSLTKSYLDRDKEPLNGPMTPENANVTGPASPGKPNTPSTSLGTFGVTANATGAIKAAVRGVPAIVLSNDVQSYARYTGGVFYAQWSASALQVHLSEIAADIHSQYLLAYVPDDLSQRGFHRLEVKVSRHGVKVRTRRGYFYEGPKQ